MKRNFVLQIDDEVRADFQRIAKEVGTDDNKLAALLVNDFAKLKPEFALKALGLIPPEWKHRRPGRPTASGTSHPKSGAVTMQDVA